MVSDDFNVASSATFKTEPARHRSLTCVPLPTSLCDLAEMPAVWNAVPCSS